MSAAMCHFVNDASAAARTQLSDRTVSICLICTVIVLFSEIARNARFIESGTF
jgi:hypothetical protein